MKYETIKTFILIILIATSLLLSVGIWSYQPNYEQFQDMSYVNQVDIGGEEMSKSDLIKPSTIIFDDGNSFYGFNNSAKRSDLFEDISSWVLYDFMVTEAKGRPSGGHLVEIVFPAPIPAEMLSSLFTFNNDINPPSWSFERVFITFNEERKSLNLSILSVDGREQIVSTVEKSEKFNVLQNYLLYNEEVIEYLAFGIPDEHPIYIPKEKITMSRSTLVAGTIEPESFINVLFSNPSLVTPNIGEAYFTDGQRGMRILQDGHLLEFINPLESTFEQMDVSELLESSVDHINEHKGWTNTYLLDDIDKQSNRIQYRLNYEGYPVFNYQNLATIEQQWQQSGLHQYTRPLLYINNILDTEPIELPRAEEVIHYLMKESSMSVEDIQDIRVGYHLSSIDDVSFGLTLSPSWYVKMRDNWTKIEIYDGKADKEGD